jgi:hypothetical protein
VMKLGVFSHSSIQELYGMGKISSKDAARLLIGDVDDALRQKIVDADLTIFRNALAQSLKLDPAWLKTLGKAELEKISQFVLASEQELPRLVANDAFRETLYNAGLKRGLFVRPGEVVQHDGGLFTDLNFFHPTKAPVNFEVTDLYGEPPRVYSPIQTVAAYEVRFEVGWNWEWLRQGILKGSDKPFELMKTTMQQAASFQIRSYASNDVFGTFFFDLKNLPEFVEKVLPALGY